jgi:hypothetical protein
LATLYSSQTTVQKGIVSRRCGLLAAIRASSVGSSICCAVIARGEPSQLACGHSQSFILLITSTFKRLSKCVAKQRLLIISKFAHIPESLTNRVVREPYATNSMINPNMF